MPRSEELRLQQLLQLQFWQRRGSRKRGASEAEGSRDRAFTLPDQWTLTAGVSLYDWQQQCVDAWFSKARRGVIKVVTGAGKTLLGLAIAERLQREEVPELRVAIVVPTVVLLEQWREEFLTRSTLPPEAIGLMGGGHADNFDERVRILICVLNSAARKLAPAVDRAGVGDKLLLIVDECHRAGATQMQRVFQTRRSYSLGLSATPERDDALSGDGTDRDETASHERRSFEDSAIGRELGPVIFELTYAEAVRRRILPPFRIVHYFGCLNWVA